MKKYYNRIEFWIIIFFLIRLIGITNPPLELGHNWRQATGLMVARNFLEVDSNILYPRVDETNGYTGIIGMELPTMNYIYYILSKAFGYTHWYGRLINLIVSSLGLYFFYKLICITHFKERIAFFSTILLAGSIWFSFSRKMMPDTYCISIMFIGLYYGLKYLEEKKIHQIILYMFFCSIAVLSKIPAGIYFVIPILFLFDTRIDIKQKAILALSTIPTLLLTYLWYFNWNFKLSSEFGNWYNSGKSIQIGFIEIIQNIDKTIDNFYFDSFSSYIVFTTFIVGTVLMIIEKEKKMIIAFLVPTLVFTFYIFKSGYYFYHHNYYIIPFVPIMALVAGYTLSQIKKKWVLLTILFAGVGEGIANQQHDFFIKGSEQYKMSIEQIMDKVSKKDDLILLNGNSNPQLLYLSHRKGWNCSDQQLTDTSYTQKIINNRCKFIVINKHSSADLDKMRLSYHKVFENDDFFIVKTINSIKEYKSQ